MTTFFNFSFFVKLRLVNYVKKHNIFFFSYQKISYYFCLNHLFVVNNYKYVEIRVKPVTNNKMRTTLSTFPNILLIFAYVETLEIKVIDLYHS